LTGELGRWGSSRVLGGLGGLGGLGRLGIFRGFGSSGYAM
jgi:hypothetical protein